MNKMKKVLIAIFACIVVCGISAPVIAANMQKNNTRVEQEVSSGKAGLSNAILNTSAISPSETAEESADTVPAEEPAPEAVTAAEDSSENLVDIQDTDLVNDAAEETEPAEQPEEPAEQPAEPAEQPEEPAEEPVDVAETEVPDTTAPADCPYYVDANGDGVCDHCAHGGACGNYVDANGDGICDYCAHGGACGNYVDADGNGVCDYCSHNGSGHCGNYSDANGDGICDNYSGGGNGGYGGGHHGGGHHGGHHW